MTYQNPFSPISMDRLDFVIKIQTEITNHSSTITREIYNKNTNTIPYREIQKVAFLLLVDENDKLLENEKEFCKNKFIYDFELDNAAYKCGEPNQCNKCKSTRYSDKFCENCISLHLQGLFDTWTSGNGIIDNFIQKCQKISSLPGHIMEWIPFDQFENVKYLTKGGFSSIYTARWTRGHIYDYDENTKKFAYMGPHNVALKVLYDSNKLGKKFFDEALNYSKIKSGLVVECYGMTKFPENDHYAIVLNYVQEGNLRNYLQENHSNLTLKDRIAMFYYLCYSVHFIHEKDSVHCDLHSGNILVQGSRCYITDLGLCGPVDDESSSKVYGITPYIAPEVLCGNKNTKESDVYSVGMLMWEIFSGCPPFDDRAHDCHLILDICKGLRPPILSNMSKDYAEMMQKCWDADPSKRPTVDDLIDFAKDCLSNINKNESSDNETTIPTMSNSNNSQRVQKPHPLAYHSSRILDDEIAKYKSLQHELVPGPVSEVISETISANEDSSNNSNNKEKGVEKTKEVN